MPEMAFVADMSGVWRRGETREITWYPRNPARTKTYRSPMSPMSIIFHPEGRLRGSGWRRSPAGNRLAGREHLAVVRDEGGPDDLVVAIDGDPFALLVENVEQEVEHVSRIELRRLRRHGRGQVHGAED